MTTPPDTPIIALNAATVQYGTKRVLSIDDMAVFPGERVFILGRSGSGKTTLSRLLKGRIAPSSGTVSLFGETAEHGGDPRQYHRHVAMVDQEFNLIPRMSVVRNVLSGALGRVPNWKTLFGLYPTEEWQKAEAILSEVELSDLGSRRVDTLSGGQKQRTAIARALMQEANIILADEPISNLDPELAEDALELIVSCVDRRNETLIVNLHQPRLARKFATRVIGLHEGRIVFDGPPEALSAEDEEFIYTGTDESAPEPLAPAPLPMPKAVRT